jgi:hypothetical protein
VCNYEQACIALIFYDDNYDIGINYNHQAGQQAQGHIVYRVVSFCRVEK